MDKRRHGRDKPPRGRRETLTEFPILQFGASRFLQAHVDLFVSEGLPRGEAMGRIAVAGTTGSPESRRRVAAFATGQPYPVLVRGVSDGEVINETVTVGSVGAGIDASTQWDELERLFIAARCAVSNTADRGYETDPGDRPDGGPPRSFPAKLAKLLLARFSAGAEPITLFPCELTPGNGQVLRGVVLDMLDRWQAPADARRWVGEECVWVNSLVDRIVSEPLEPLGRGRRALCPLGDRGPAGPRASLPASGHRRRRRSQALRAAEALHPQSRPHLSRGDLGSGQRALGSDRPRGGGGHSDAREP